MSEVQSGYVGLVIMLVLLAFASIYLAIDNAKLRNVIRSIQHEKDALTNQLKASIDQQAAILNVLKFVMQGEIKTARTDEREQIFAIALARLTAIERDIYINLSNVGERANVGQAAVGQGIGQRKGESGEHL